jgi:Predicted nucleotide-binding protein containing TIR-like domain
MKPRLFIGSSTEGRDVAEKVQQLLSPDIEGHIWDQPAGGLGEHIMDSLRREMLLSDFALLIVSPDDQIVKRGREVYSARDNVLFELGLFMGALGAQRSAYLVVTDKRKERLREVAIPSDLSGISRLNIELTDSGFEWALRAECTKLKAAIRREMNAGALSVLPSTALAIGYFKNFVLQACKALYSKTNFEIEGRTYDLTKDIFDFHIVLPNDASDASHAGFLKFTRNRKLVQTSITGADASRGFPFYVDARVIKGRIQMFDYPTTLRAAREAVLLASGRRLSDTEIASLEMREIRNFGATLEKLLASPDAADFRDNVHVKFVSDLPTDSSMPRKPKA